jgi:hypothetical protein
MMRGLEFPVDSPNGFPQRTSGAQQLRQVDEIPRHHVEFVLGAKVAALARPCAP